MTHSYTVAGITCEGCVAKVKSKLLMHPDVLAADVKLAVEDVLVSRLTTLSAGERLTLAKRSSGRVAAALLQDTDKRVIPAALNNPYLTETLVAKALLHPKPSPLHLEQR